MLDIVRVIAGVTVLALPGVCFWRVLFRDDGWVEHLTWGSTAGLALAVLTAHYASLVRLSWFWPAWLAVVGAGLVAAWFWRSRKPAYPADNRPPWLLAVLLLIVAVSRFAPTFFRDTPPGWDPSFHLILARKLLLNGGMIHDWTPFEPVSINYPLGSHLLMALLSAGTGVSLPRVFQLLIPLLGVISTAQVYAYSQRVFRRQEIALYAALAYGMWAFGGSIGYYIWGGLPNQLAMMFLIALLAMIPNESMDSTRTLAAGVFLAGVVMTHHHVALVAAATMTAVFARAARSQKERIRLLMVCGVGVLLALPYLAPRVIRASEIGRTEVLRFIEPHTLPWMVADLGIVLVATGIAGMVLCRRDPRVRVAFAAAGTLLLLYLLCGPLYRAYALARWHREYVAFTPSRFLTDLAYLLSVFTGYAMYRLATHYRWRPRAVLAAGMVIALTHVPHWMEAYAREPDAGRRQAHAWIQRNTPPEAIVLDTDPWTSFETWRRTPQTPLPVSEPLVTDNAARHAVRELAQFRAPAAPEVVRVIAPGGILGDGRVLWRAASGWTVVQVWPVAQNTAAAP